MKLSIIIVNYNVKFFLEQCLYSVLSSIKNTESEIIVVDNNSVDGSCAMVREKFPRVRILENKTNKGFSCANNQAIKISKGEYILLLNPDTVVDEFTFEKTLEFMDTHPDAGSLGVKMIDGKGRFLPESKRALPTPEVAFYKIFGLARLFPRSKRFNRYHLGYLNRDEINEVDVLPGAFMLLRKKTLDKTGLLDEDFFMYGEDIDLSYRILKAGYKNYYYPKTTIIHYKGESTKKGSINYVRIFYNAMIIFAQKHFSGSNAKFLILLIKFAIYFRAGFAVITRLNHNFLLPVLDMFVIYSGYYIIKPFWEQYKFHEDGKYPDVYLNYVVPGYILVWIMSVYLGGGYRKPVKLEKVVRGIAVGTLIILVIYALLSEQYRFSRVLIFMGAVWAFVLLLAIRLILHSLKFPAFRVSFRNRKRIIIVGEKDEASRVHDLMKQSNIRPYLIGYVSPLPNGHSSEFIGSIDQLKEIVEVNKAEEIIFCARDISSHQIIKNMLKLSNVNVDYKIAPPESISVIGSNSVNSAGELYIVNSNTIATESSRRNKRLLDITISTLLLLFSPLLVFYIKNPVQFIINSFKVLIGSYSWVGYSCHSGLPNGNLPKIKISILSPVDAFSRYAISTSTIERLNINYAKDYNILNDFSIILKALKKIGRKVTENR